MFFTLMGFWCLKYLTDTAGLPAFWAGAAWLIGKAWDAVTDPMMGFISDRTLTRWGRRRPYLLFGAVPMLLTMAFFFTAPPIENPLLLTLWATLALMLLNTAATVTGVPYGSLTPELTDDYHERTSLNGYRFGCAVFGTILGAALVQPIVDIFPSSRTGFSMMGFILGAVMMITTLLTFFGTKEKPRRREDLPTRTFFETYRAVFLNKPYVTLLLIYALNITGLTLLQTILSYYIEYVFQRPDMTPLALMILLLTAMVFIPVSVLVSKKIGKRKTYQICFAILASACMIIFFLGHILGLNFFLGLMVYAGIGVGFGYVAPYAMVPDAIDFDAVKSGERNEGAYYGMWTFISKLGSALAGFISGIILTAGGYVPRAVQSESALTAIRLITGPLPAVILAGALVLAQFYTIDEAAYRKLMEGTKAPSKAPD
ncbi:sugar transporter [Spirochaetia bacterium]|nr:sugar transporter [Spirochaetia bacterium]